MKYIVSLFFVIILASCSGTKKVVENASKAETKTVKKQDSISEKEIIKVESPKRIETHQKDSILPKAINEEKKDSIYFIKITSHDKWNSLLKKHVSEKGDVDYVGFKKDKSKINNYLKYLSKNLPTDKWLKQHELAYWINAYNAMTIDLILHHYPIKSIKDIKNPWEQRFWKLGEKWYNLNDIEHQILRKMDEPRIHFAIVCASVSCPKLLNEAYSATNLEEQLTKVTKDFLNDSERNSITENNLKLSKIFQWFAKDFKQNGSLIDFLNQYSEVEISAKAKKSFKTYNWDLNE